MNTHEDWAPGRRPAPVTGSAADIAVSEMTSVPITDMDGWVLVVIRRTGAPQGEGALQTVILPCDVGYVQDGRAEDALAHAIRDMRSPQVTGL